MLKGRGWLAWLGIASLASAQTPMPHASRPGPVMKPADPPPLVFRFDGGFEASPGLGFTLSRPVATVDPGGRVIGADEPRYDVRRSIAGATMIEDVRASPWNTKVLGSGLGHDGVTPVLVLWESSTSNLDVFMVAGDELMAAEAGAPGRNRTVCKGYLNAPDLFRGAIAGRAYAPEAGAVCHGLIVLLCTVSVYEASTQAWRQEAVALAASQDDGATWALLYEDAPAQVGVDRAREWSMQNFWTFERGVAPTEAYFVATDYRSKPDTTGGRVVMIRARRASAGAGWMIDPGATVYSTESTAGQHVHTPAVVPFGEGGLRVVVAVGDNSTFNRIVSLTRGDDVYWDVDGWTVDEAYHGWAGNPGSNGNQFIGCAPMADPNEVIAGSDLTGEQLMRLRAGDGAHPDHGRLYGWGMSEGFGCQNFVVRTPTPERGGPYVAKYEPSVSMIGDPGSYRILYSPDGERWAPIFAPGGSSGWSMALHGPHVYIDGTAGVVGVRRVMVPEIRTGRPLVIGPGAMQRLTTAPTVVGQSNGKVTVLSRDAEGKWVDGGVALDPQPPSAGPVYRVDTWETDPGVLAGDLLPLGGKKNFGQVLGTGNFAIRYWVMNASRATGARPNFQLRSDTANLWYNRTAAATVTDGWQPVMMAGSTPPLADQNLRIRIRSGQTAAVTQSFYLAHDVVSEGIDSPGYPPPADASGQGTRYPDEIGVIDGFVCGDRWTITLACQVPEDSWDRFLTGTPSRMHVATLVGEPGDWIHLFVDLFQNRVVAYVYEEGEYVGAMRGPVSFWHRESPILISLAQPGDGTGLQATISSGGVTAALAQKYAPFPLMTKVRPRRILMGDPTGESGDSVTSRVSPMLWWGGRIDPQRALSESERVGVLSTLGFLPEEEREGHARGDVDGNGIVDARDVAAWREAWVRGERSADVNRDGRGDWSDLVDLLQILRER